jgi:hypothetical protein
MTAHPEPRRSKSYGAVIQGLAAGTAVIVSVASLYIAWRQSGVMERQLAASVWPALQYTTSNLDSAHQPVIALAFHNGGIGPARIRAFELAYHGAPIADAESLLAACCAAPGTDPAALSLVTNNEVTSGIVPAGQTIPFLSATRDAASSAQWQLLDQARHELTGRICYCSALDDCWTIEFPGSPKVRPQPVAVASCDAAVARPQYQ